MLMLAHHYPELLTSAAGIYRARVYGQPLDDGRWGGWIVFFPAGGGRVISTERETTQSSLDDLAYWASGLTPVYIAGALERAIALQPEAVLARELEQLDYEEAAAAARAESLEAQASLARAESKLVEAARERTEEQLLETVAATAETDAVVHEHAAAAARREAKAAGRALQERKRGRTGSARTPAAKKK